MAPRAPLAALALLLAAPGLRAAAEAGQAGAYLRAGAGARGAALGGACSALAAGPEALAWNPAGLADFRGLGLSSSLELLSLGRRLDSAQLEFAPGPGLEPAPGDFPPGSPWGAWALGWQGFSLGDDFEGRAGDSAGYYRFGDREDAFSLAQARAPLPWLALGAALKLYTHSIADYSARGWGLDLGLLLRAGRALRLGLAAGDLGSTLSWSTGSVENLPAWLRLGAAAELLSGRLLLAAQLESLQGRGASASAGAELDLLGFLRLRGGLSAGGLSFGGGARLPLGGVESCLDYAWKADPLGQGASQRLSLALGF